MDRSYPFSRRIEQRRRFRRRVLATLSAGVGACALWFVLTAQAEPEPAAMATPVAPAATMTATASLRGSAPAPRRVYRYSVVPGGVADGAELARLVRSDRAVGAHYAGFDVARARPVTVSRPRAVYVSYRKGDRIYWTSRKLMLQAGETLLTDGRNEMRARCANWISDLPRLPVEPHGPGPGQLDIVEEEDFDGTAGEITYVIAPAPLPAGDVPELTGQPFQPIWPAETPPRPDRDPPARTPFPDAPIAGLPWPQTGWLGYPGVPPQAGTTPGPATPANRMPPPLIADLGPFIPPRDPNQPAPPPNPALDEPHPADVPEPGSAWLFAGALAVLLARRSKR